GSDPIDYFQPPDIKEEEFETFIILEEERLQYDDEERDSEKRETMIAPLDSEAEGGPDDQRGGHGYHCGICGTSLSSRLCLLRHRTIHTGERPYFCELCGKTFRGSDKLLLHKRTHTGEKPYPCDLCGNGFVSASKLERHRKTHTGERPHVCGTCGKGFIRLSGLRNHVCFRKRAVRFPAGISA
uniref:C2H2-type domain-containing protein n=1 Tax=Oryzias latipes TaxID=8090 RepID=A0A3B3HP25_ORYLA